ncbi:hypothetical protein JCGZ_22371 [Jatropha curcas]|uniref:Myb-like domain-containing protein n=1 Tax=Jatropha curcas TaxID=180498 RepID=A0A067LHT2_JATCU|nr:hypothetical protein JCGZ_22371 [Jatropha curcas]
MKRWNMEPKNQYKKGLWTEEEGKILMDYVNLHGKENGIHFKQDRSLEDNWECVGGEQRKRRRRIAAMSRKRKKRVVIAVIIIALRIIDRTEVLILEMATTTENR